MKTIIITGAGGFIGRALARYFTASGYTVYGLDRLDSEKAPLSSLAKYIQAELPSPIFRDLLQQWRPDAILHCAGRASVTAAMENPQSDYVDGPALTFDLLENVRINSPKCIFLLLSSAAVYGEPRFLPVNENVVPQPISAYGFHKWQSELICREFASLFGLRTASARVFSAYGPGLRRQVIWDITRKALLDPEVHLQGTGKESRDFIHVNDIARGLETLMNGTPSRGEVYNLASGQETRIADLAALILKILNSTKTLQFSGKLPPGTPRNWRADISSISRLGFKPEISIETGVTDFVEWSRREIAGV